MHVTIQESSMNNPKPSTSNQITTPIASNNNRDKNRNSYKMKKKSYYIFFYSSMEHYYDELNHVPTYQKKIYRTDSMGFLNQVEILRNFTIKYGLPLP